MSYSFIVLDLSGKANLQELDLFFRQNYVDYEVLYCTKKDVSYPNFKVFCVEEKANQNMVLNAVCSLCTKNNMVVIRDFSNLDDIKRQTKALRFTNQIVLFDKVFPNFKRGFMIFFQKLGYVIFSKEVVFFNNSCITYGEIATNVLKKLECPANLINANDWDGVQMVMIEGGTTQKVEYNKPNNILKFIVPLLVMLLMIGLFFIIPQKSVLAGIIIWGTAIISFILSLIFAVNWFIKSHIGDTQTNKAKIKKGDKYEKN